MKKLIITVWSFSTIILCSFGLYSNVYSQGCSVTNISPPNGATINTLTPTLNWSIYNSVGCQCQVNYYIFSTTVNIATDSLMNSIIYTYGSNGFLNSHTIPGGYLQYSVRYWWRITFYIQFSCVGCSGGSCEASSARWSFTPLITGIERIGTEISSEYLLSQNYPNPFNPTTNIKFSIPEEGYVSLKIYDITGSPVQTYVDGLLKAGTYNAEVDGSNLSSGVYFYTLLAGYFVETKKMVLIK